MPRCARLPECERRRRTEASALDAAARCGAGVRDGPGERAGVQDWAHPGSTNAPPVDIRQAENGYIVEVELPGLGRKDFSVDVDPNLLTVASNADQAAEHAGQGYVVTGTPLRLVQARVHVAAGHRRRPHQRGFPGRSADCASPPGGQAEAQADRSQRRLVTICPIAARELHTASVGLAPRVARRCGRGLQRRVSPERALWAAWMSAGQWLLMYASTAQISASSSTSS